MEQKPSVGRIVHYHIEDNGEPIAAIITRAIDGGVVDLTLFSPPLERPQVERITCAFSPTPRAKCWSWPPRV